ncbi:putative Thiosulfate sulfurtransferase [Paratrimastix pyriformis]|uniref:Sulfurtransferase n=1 Tax=Paratrimastix pyriformis TaxID=342808 RepID=A0ABQ8U5C7_9EUKA|nr:putative Thiosulfate sulfurtransferase [Paratrimastix pyriformis]
MEISFPLWVLLSSKSLGMQTLVYFRVRCPETAFGDSLLMPSSMNNWDLHTAAALTTSQKQFPMWYGYASLSLTGSETTRMQFKFVLQSADSSLRWEPFNGNREISLNLADCRQGVDGQSAPILIDCDFGTQKEQVTILRDGQLPAPFTTFPDRYLVSTEWLDEHLSDPDLVVLDGSYYWPSSKRDASAEYQAGHIPGAIHFSIDEYRDKSHPVPVTLLAPADFARAVGQLGIGDGTKIVIYDGGWLSAPRALWNFHVMGAQAVMLDGGAAKWRAEQRPWTATPTAPRHCAHFTPVFQADRVATLETVKQAAACGTPQIIDARAVDRYAGETPEQRPGVRTGHIPGSFNVPFGSLVANGRLKPRAEIEAVFTAAGVDLAKPTIASCGVGLTAATLWLALSVIGRPPVSLYDGSWTEWGHESRASECPAELGRTPSATPRASPALSQAPTPTPAAPAMAGPAPLAGPTPIVAPVIVAPVALHPAQAVSPVPPPKAVSPVPPPKAVSPVGGQSGSQQAASKKKSGRRHSATRS